MTACFPISVFTRRRWRSSRSAARRVGGNDLIELLNNKLHGLSPPGGLVSPSGRFASLLFDQGVPYYSQRHLADRNAICILHRSDCAWLCCSLSQSQRVLFVVLSKQIDSLRNSWTFRIWSRIRRTWLTEFEFSNGTILFISKTFA